MLVPFLFLVIAPTEENEAKVLEKARVAILTRDYGKALRYAEQVFKTSKNNELKAEALFVWGKIAETIASNLTDRAWQEVEPRGASYRDDDFMQWSGLRPYEDIGLKFDWSNFGQNYIYDGASYREIIRSITKTKWACAASFKLLKLEKRKGAEWEGAIQPAKEDIKKLERFLRECPQPEVKSEILLELAKDYVYLISCHEYRASPDFDKEKAVLYIQKAEEVLKRIKNEYLNFDDLKEINFLLDSVKRSRELLGDGE